MPEPAFNIESLQQFFIDVLAGDADTLRRIDDSDLDLELAPAGFVFTLPALHALLDLGQQLDYAQFRKLVYASTLNQELSAFDAEVVTFDSSGKIDTSRYCLRRRTSA